MPEIRQTEAYECGGDKRSQARDIKQALKLARELE
jgi:putative component of toxin-antitoxin plasmid stabilization module